LEDRLGLPEPPQVRGPDLGAASRHPELASQCPRGGGQSKRALQWGGRDRARTPSWYVAWANSWRSAKLHPKNGLGTPSNRNPFSPGWKSVPGYLLPLEFRIDAGDLSHQPGNRCDSVRQCSGDQRPPV